MLTVAGIGAFSLLAQAQDEDSAAPLLYPPTTANQPQTQTTDSANPEVAPTAPTQTPRPTVRQQLPVMISMPTLAQNLRKIDPKTTIEWDGRVLRISGGNQKISVFGQEKSMVVNGMPEKVKETLTFNDGEIFIAPELATTIEGKIKTAMQATPTPAPTPMPRENDTTTTKPTVEPTQKPKPTPITIELVGDDDSTQPEQETSISVELSTKKDPDAVIPVIVTPTPEPTKTPEPTPEPTATPKPQKLPKEQGTTTTEPEVKKMPSFIAESQFGTLENEQKLLNELELKTTSDRSLLAAQKATSLRMVIIDPEPDSRSQNKKAIEALNISTRLTQTIAEELKTLGVQTIMTAHEGEPMHLAKRMKVINENRGKAQVMIAVRIGIGQKRSAGGARIYFMNESVDANAIEPLQNDKVTPERTYQVFAPQSKQLATLLNKAIHKNDETIKPMPMATWLARRAPMPTVMIYGGNMANDADAETLRDNDKMKDMASAIAKTLVEFGMTISTTPTTTGILAETQTTQEKEGE